MLRLATRLIHLVKFPFPQKGQESKNFTEANLRFKHL